MSELIRPGALGVQTLGVSPLGLGWRDIAVTVGRLRRRSLTLRRVAP